MCLEGRNDRVGDVGVLVLVVYLGRRLGTVKNTHIALFVARKGNRFVLGRVEAEGVHSLRRDLDVLWPLEEPA